LIPTDAYIGLGSNLDNPEQQLRTAVAELDTLTGTRLAAVSSWYRSAPLGPAGQPDYINAVARIVTSLPPLALLRELQAVENRHGRVRTRRWGPRTLDLDILLYGDCQLSTPELCIPHPQLALRNFVIYPLAELAPDLTLPDGTALARLLAKVTPEGIVRLRHGD